MQSKQDGPCCKPAWLFESPPPLAYISGTTNWRAAPKISIKAGRNRRGPRSSKRLHRIFSRDHGICHLCGMPTALIGMLKHDDGDTPSLDHLIPKSMGGDSSDDNLKLAHRRCNNARGNRMLDEPARTAAGAS